MEDNVAKIKERLNVVDVLSGYIKVQKAGINYKARCPFHNEKTPSFYISPERQIWHCFGCSLGGDMFTFVEKMEGVDFSGALEILANKAGIELERFERKDKELQTSLYDITELASKFFEKQLHQSALGKQALAYLEGRGLSETTIREFRLGFAPNEWRSLSDFFLTKGSKRDDIVAAGLAIKKDNNELIDRFRSRIMFPIADINDRIVGFTGRVFGDNHPPDVGKYINTPQTAIYDKSKVIYGLNKAKMEVRSQNRCLLVEGNIDVIMSSQAGVKNVAASSGTALTQNHLQILQRYTNSLDFCFDTDQAGSIATRRGIGMALAKNFNVKIVQLPDPECKDPADYVQKYGQKWLDVSVSGKPALEFYFDKSRQEMDLSTVEGKKGIIASLAPLVRRLSSNIEKAHWISRLSILLKTKEDAVAYDINAAKDDLAAYDNESAVEVKKTEPKLVIKPLSQDEMLDQALLAVILKNPLALKAELQTLDSALLQPMTTQAVSYIKNAEPFDFDSMVKEFDNPMPIEFAYIRSLELFSLFSDEELRSEFASILDQIKRRQVSAKLAVLEFDIRQAEENKDRDKMVELLTQFSELSQKLNK